MDTITESTTEQNITETIVNNDAEPVIEDDEGEMDNDVDDVDDVDDDDDDDMLHVDMDVPLMEDGDSLPVTSIPQAPSKDCRWNNNAIMECLQLALQSHDDDPPNARTTTGEDKPRSRVWNPPPLAMDAQGNPLSEQEIQFLATWKPKSLTKPAWATNLLLQP